MEANRPKVIEVDGNYRLGFLTPFGRVFATHKKKFGSYIEALNFLKQGTKVNSYKCDDCGRITTLQIFAPRDDDDVCGFCGGKLKNEQASLQER